MKHSNTHHSMRQYRRSRRRRRSMRRHRPLARRSRRVFCDIGNCGVGITTQMCNRVTNHGDMGIFSRPDWAPLEFYFQEQSYSSLHSGRTLAWDYVRGDIDYPCGTIADFCGVNTDFSGVIVDLCGVVTIPEAIGGRRCRSLRDSLNINTS